MDWFYVKDGQRAGPVSEAEFQGLVQSGAIIGETLVWHQGMAQWQAYRAAAGPAGVEPTQLVTCASCGQSFPLSEVIQFENSYVCASCKPRFVQQLKEGNATTALGVTYAGFWTRFSAVFLDGILLGIISLATQTALAFTFVRDSTNPAGLVVMMLNYFVGLLFGVTYETWMIGKYGATLGKMAAKVKVVMADGQPLTYGRACARYFAKLVSYLTLYIGFIIAGFDKEKRALHDYMCNTRVIKT
jgi:uncharacterized RDD family membrane protein YckC